MLTSFTHLALIRIAGKNPKTKHDGGRGIILNATQSNDDAADLKCVVHDRIAKCDSHLYSHIMYVFRV